MIQASHRRQHEDSGNRCAPLPALGELPQLTALSLAWRRLIDVKPVLMAVRSGSALLEQLRRVTPQGLRLLSVDANPSKLLIKGESQGTDAFQRINALDLNLESLPGMLLDGTTVVKAQADKQGRIAFSLEAKLDPAMKPTPGHLRGLGAEGLAQRLELLQGEGLLP